MDSKLTIIAIIAIIGMAGYYIISQYGGSQANIPQYSNKDIEVMRQLHKEDLAQFQFYQKLLLRTYDIDFRVYLLNLDESSSADAYIERQFIKEGIGALSSRQYGLMVVVDSTHDVIRIKASPALMDIIDPAFQDYIQNRFMVPYFAHHQLHVGIQLLCKMLVERADRARRKLSLIDYNALEKRMDDAKYSTLAVYSGRDENIVISNHSDIPAGETVEETFELYKLKVLALNPRSDLDIFNEEARLPPYNKLAHAIQLGNGARVNFKCEAYQRPNVLYNETRTRAAIMSSLDDRQCGPFLFEKGEDGQWRLDKLAYGYSITYTTDNTWWMDLSPARLNISNIHKYDFAFQDMVFDMFVRESDTIESGKLIGGTPYYQDWGMRIGYGYGVDVTALHPASVLAKAGLLEGDVILSWDGNPLVSLYNQSQKSRLSIYLHHAELNASIPIEVLRGAEILDLNVTAPPFNEKGGRWGVRFENHDGSHPYVQRLSERSPLHALGVKEGDILTSFNGTAFPYDDRRKIYNYSALKIATRKAQPGSSFTLGIRRMDESGAYEDMTLSGQIPPRRVSRLYY